MQSSGAPFALLSCPLPGFQAGQAKDPTCARFLARCPPSGRAGQGTAGGANHCPHLCLLPRPLLALVVVAPLLLLLLARLSPLHAVLGAALLPAVSVVRIIRLILPLVIVKVPAATARWTTYGTQPNTLCLRAVLQAEVCTC